MRPLLAPEVNSILPKPQYGGAWFVVLNIDAWSLSLAVDALAVSVSSKSASNNLHKESYNL